MKKQRVRLKLKSYDHKLLDDAVKLIVSTGKRTGSQIAGPVPLPNKKRCFTVLRSPHVNKKSREQFELTTHMRIVDIVALSDQTMDALMKLNISSGVDVEISSIANRSKIMEEKRHPVAGVWGTKIGIDANFFR